MILGNREKRRRGTVSLAVQCVVAGNTVTADEQDRKASWPMVLAAALSVQGNKPSEGLNETVPI